MVEKQFEVFPGLGGQYQKGLEAGVALACVWGYEMISLTREEHSLGSSCGRCHQSKGPEI